MTVMIYHRNLRSTGLNKQKICWPKVSSVVWMINSWNVKPNFVFFLGNIKKFKITWKMYKIGAKWLNSRFLSRRACWFCRLIGLTKLGYAIHGLYTKEYFWFWLFCLWLWITQCHRLHPTISAFFRTLMTNCFSLIFTARCTLVQSAVLRSHVVCPFVCPSVTLVDCDHIGWNSSEIISPLVSYEMFLSADSNIGGLLQGEHPEILAQSHPPPVDLSVGDIRSQIAAEWLQIAQRSQWRAYRKPPSFFRMVRSLTPYDLLPSKWGFHMPPRYANGHISATGVFSYFTQCYTYNHVLKPLLPIDTVNIPIIWETDVSHNCLNRKEFTAQSPAFFVLDKSTKYSYWLYV